MDTKARRLVIVLLAAFAALCLLAACSNGAASSSASSSGSSQSSDGALPVSDAPEPDTTIKFDSPFYILIAGSDTRDGTVSEGKGGHGADGHSRTDTMMLLRVDPVNHGITIITVPRDTRTTINGEVCKLNQSYDVGGMELVKDQVEQLTGVKVRYWFVTKMADLVPLMDGVGGIDVDVPISLSGGCMVTGRKYTLEPGYQHLSAEEASVLIQQRKQYGDNMDACRQMQGRKVVEFMIRHVAAMDADGAEVCANLLLSLCTTDMPADECVALVREFAEHGDQLWVVSCTGPYDGDIDPETELWLTYRDEQTWRALIDAVEWGRDPIAIVPLPEVYAG